MNRTANFWSFVATECRKVARLLPVAGFTGPNVETVREVLTKAAIKADAFAAEEESKGNISAKVEVKGGNGRTERPVPAGTFQRRERIVMYRGQKFQVGTIAEAIVAILDYNAANKIGLDDKVRVEAAAAIQKAYPENTYGAHRVDYDAKKWANGVFSCQRKKAGNKPVEVTGDEEIVL